MRGIGFHNDQPTQVIGSSACTISSAIASLIWGTMRAFDVEKGMTEAREHFEFSVEHKLQHK